MISLVYALRLNTMYGHCLQDSLTFAGNCPFAIVPSMSILTRIDNRSSTSIRIGAARPSGSRVLAISSSSLSQYGSSPRSLTDCHNVHHSETIYYNSSNEGYHPFILVVTQYPTEALCTPFVGRPYRHSSSVRLSASQPLTLCPRPSLDNVQS